MKTPMVQLDNNLFVKFDMFNEGGSHKTRAARHIVSEAIKRGDITPGITTVIEKTGGNFGFGLIKACKELGVDVELAVGLGFSIAKRKYLESLGAKLIGIDELKRGKTPKEVIERQLAEASAYGKQYFYTDQFNNSDGLDGHVVTTGAEVVQQLSQLTSRKDIIFVSCAGTGACLMGVLQSLESNDFNVTTYFIEPEGCDSENGLFVDHRFEGMSVGVTPPFIDWSVIDRKFNVSLVEMLATQKMFFSTSGHLIGNTSAACLHIAKLVSKNTPDKIVFSMIYDHGLWYDDLINTP
ncbi:cysteine synthase [Sinobacterium caligoides]|uniref:cysteine synthase n=1 Tax=Sinobacterium caligoides TaxID=933926 RepID=A0A3N2DGH5_9GAMM|nr:pyridoxal-phosphate dependent enzyme [Sinobacterium caligoides]ROR98900.1 cysteine synthase [Sinobacterium caligoides]